MTEFGSNIDSYQYYIFQSNLDEDILPTAYNFEDTRDSKITKYLVLQTF